MDLDNYGLDFVIWIFCPPLLGTTRETKEVSAMVVHKNEPAALVQHKQGLLVLIHLITSFE